MKNILSSFLIAGLLIVSGISYLNAADVEPSDKVYKLALRGEVETGLTAFIKRGIATAEVGNAKAFLLDIDTPGGRVDAALAIKDALLGANVPIITYVNRHALSAGALIAMAGKDMYMAPGSAIGAATPVIGDVSEKAPEKIVSALRSAFASTAEARGRSPNLAKAMVDEDIKIRKFAPEGKLLTLTARETVQLEFSEGIKADEAAVLATIGAQPGDVIELKTSTAEEFVRFITSSAVSSLLLTIGFLGLTLELKTPGFGLGGILAIAAYGLFFWGHHLAGLAGMEDILLVLGGIFLILIEFFVIPGFGVIGIAGLIAVLAGLLLALTGNPAVVPMETYIDAATNIAMALTFAIILSLVIIRLVFKDKMFASGFVLKGSYDSEDEIDPMSVSRETDEREISLRIGDIGTAHTDLRPAGTAIFEDEKYSVVTQGDYIEANKEIEIVEIEGTRIVVRLK